uniref:Uncharacterized protein n=1 Tax=viral metagenome TaxID=1070528 RepID=A0A6C0J4V0_9ZZZZ
MILLGVEILIICALGYGIKKIFFNSYTRTNYLLTYEPTENNDDTEIPPKYEDISSNISSSSLISLQLYE